MKNDGPEVGQDHAAYWAEWVEWQAARWEHAPDELAAPYRAHLEWLRGTLANVGEHVGEHVGESGPVPDG